MAEITLLSESAGRAKWSELVQAAQTGDGGYMVVADGAGNLFGIPLGMAGGS